MLGGIVLVAVIATFASFDSARAQTSETPLTANAIFDRARSVANAREFPDFYRYRLDTRIERKGNVQEEHYFVTVRRADGVSFVEPLKDSPRDRRDTRPQVRPSPPFVAPARTFGLATLPTRSGPSIFEAAEPVATATPAPQATTSVIGRSIAISRDYDVALAGTETVDGRESYHLIVTPRFSPERKLLRELFIDRANFHAVREIIQVAANAGPVRARPLATIDYQDFAAGYVIARAAAHVDLRMLVFTVSADVSLRATEFAPVEHPPTWMFDAALLKEHERQTRAR